MLLRVVFLWCQSVNMDFKPNRKQQVVAALASFVCFINAYRLWDERESSGSSFVVGTILVLFALIGAGDGLPALASKLGFVKRPVFWKWTAFVTASWAVAFTVVALNDQQVRVAEAQADAARATAYAAQYAKDTALAAAKEAEENRATKSLLKAMDDQQRKDRASVARQSALDLLAQPNSEGYEGADGE